MNSPKCPLCGAKDTISSITPPPGADTFMLIGASNDGSFDFPPKGISVKVRGCTNCGYVMLGSKHIINAEITER